MEEDIVHTEKVLNTKQDFPPSGSGQHHTTWDENERKFAAEHFILVPLEATLQPISFAIPSTAHNTTAAKSTVEQNNIYGILVQQGSGIGDIDIDILSFESISGANTTTSGSRGNRGRDLVPLA